MCIGTDAVTHKKIISLWIEFEAKVQARTSLILNKDAMCVVSELRA